MPENMINTNDIAVLLDGANLPPLREAAFLSRGENNENYRLTLNDDTRCVLRRKRTVSTEGSLLNEHAVLSYLDATTPGFAPRSLFFNPETGVHVIAFVEGAEIRPADFTPETSSIFAENLARLHGVDMTDFAAFCGANGFPPPVIETLHDTFDTYFTQSFAFIREHCPNAKLADWIEPHVATMAETVLLHDQWPPTLSHGDIGGNMLWDGENLVFIDWERARFMQSHELGYCFVHGHCPPDMQTRVTDRYADAAGYDASMREKLRREIALQMRLLMLDTVIWPARRYTELARASDAEAPDYLRRAQGNIERFESCAQAGETP